MSFAKILAFAIFFQSIHGHAAEPPKPAGRIQDVKGKVLRLTQGQTTMPVKNGDVIYEGDVIQSQVGAGAKIVFTDKTEMAIGSDSKVVVEPHTEGPPSAQFLRGTTRVKVVPSKSEKPKFLLKTKSATMGVRGTDFQVVFNPGAQLTSVLTFEGNVVMGKTPENLADPSRSVSITPGTFSALTPTQELATQPVKISPAQLESLKTGNLLSAPTTTSPKNPVTAPPALSPIPPGLNPKTVMAQEALPATTPQPDAPPPEGKVDSSTGAITPPAGGYLDLKTGVYLPPPPGSAYDPVTQVYIPPSNMGNFDPKTGSYVPPTGFVLDAQRGFVAESTANVPPPAGAPAASAAAPFGGMNPQTFASGNMATALPPPGADISMLGGAAGTFAPSINNYVSSTATTYSTNPVAPAVGPNSMPQPITIANTSTYFDPFSGQPFYPPYDPGLCQVACNPFNQPGTTNAGSTSSGSSSNTGTTTASTATVNVTVN